MRKKIIAANWKMNMTVDEAESFFDTFLLEVGEETPSRSSSSRPSPRSPKSPSCLSKVQNVKLGAQNMHAEKSGAFTGEISAAMLRELFVRYVVLGHSERRTLFGETDEIVNKKTQAALAATLKPIVCIGETLAERDGRQGRGGARNPDPRQPRRTLAQGTRRHRHRLRARLGHRHRPHRHARSRRRKRTLSSARSSPRFPTQPPRTKCASNTAAA